MKIKDVLEWLLLGAIWGASFLFMRVATREFHPIALIEVRVAVASLFLLVPLAWSGNLSLLKAHAFPLMVLGAVNSAIPFSLFAYATKYLKAGDAAVLNATAPLFGALVGYAVFHEKISRQKVCGLLLGFGGVILLVWQNISASAHLSAVIAGLTAAVLYGFSVHYNRKMLSGVPPLVVSTGSLIGATVLLMPVSIFVWPTPLPSLPTLGCSIALGVLCTAIAYLLYFRLLRNVGAARSMTVAYLIPVFGILWGYLLLAEPVSWTTLLGGLVVLIGTMLVNLPEQTTAETLAWIWRRTYPINSRRTP